MASGKSSRYDEVIRLGDDRFITIDFQIAPIRDEAGRVTHLVPSAIDITDCSQAENRLRENEARLRAILDTAADGIITIDDHGTVLSFNAAAERMFGYQAAEIRGSKLSLLMPSPHREQHDAHLARYRATGTGRVISTVLETTAQRRDGTVFPIELSVSEVRGLNLFTGIVRDISVRRQAAPADHHDRRGAETADRAGAAR